MIEGKTVLAVITARGGSKGLPRKNILDVGGKPLIAWTIEAARKSAYIDRLILSSEDEEIISVATRWGCEVPFRRPPELSRDEIPAAEPVLHALKAIRESYDYVVLLQPTSPLRTAEDIDGCITQCVTKGAPACVSMMEADKSPSMMFKLNEDGHFVPLVKWRRKKFQRQDFPTAYTPNGAVYIAETEWFKVQRLFLTPETVAYTMPRERSIDVDTQLDLKICETLLSERSRSA